MISELIFATGNAHKVSEIQAALPEKYLIKSLKDIGFDQPLKEPFFTLEENAQTKAEQLKAATGYDCFAEDSGLFIHGLMGEPGVLSARYSGTTVTDEKNIEKVLHKLSHQTDRSAYFKTVIHLIFQKKHHVFTGICSGNIASQPRGDNGFGYDPIFIPDARPENTFAQLSQSEKNSMSHRARATAKFVDFLQKKNL